MSLPISATGMVLVWIGVGVTNPRAATAYEEGRTLDNKEMRERAKGCTNGSNYEWYTAGGRQSHLYGHAVWQLEQP